MKKTFLSKLSFLILLSFLLVNCEKDSFLEPEEDLAGGELFTKSGGRTLAFPEALGAGAYTMGGRFGRIIEVTNLNDRGPGSFREAVTATGRRIVVFRVGGTIELESEITLTRANSYLTIAGQTAPGDGILISGHKMHYPEPWRGNLLELTDYAHQIIVRYLRFRVGRNQYTPSGHHKPTEQTGDCLTIWHYGGPDNTAMRYLMFDHCSFSWSQDENIQISANVIYTTFQNNIISEGLNYNHPSCGVLACQSPLSTISLSFIRNYFVHNWNRNPWLSIKKGLCCNNVVYNYGQEGMELRGGVHADIVNNYFKAGPSTYRGKKELRIWDEEHCAHGGIPNVYMRGNIGSSVRENRNNWLMPKIEGLKIRDIKRNSFNSFWDNYPLNKLPANDLKYWLLNRSHGLGTVGANRRVDKFGMLVANQDTVDRRVINDFFDGDGVIALDENSVEGFPVMNTDIPYPDADHDGMSDIWEINNGLDPNNPNDGRLDKDGDGYTNVEEFLNYSDVNVANSKPHWF
jgi:hypothetical protein